MHVHLIQLVSRVSWRADHDGGGQHRGSDPESLDNHAKYVLFLAQMRYSDKRRFNRVLSSRLMELVQKASISFFFLKVQLEIGADGSTLLQLSVLLVDNLHNTEYLEATKLRGVKKSPRAMVQGINIGSLGLVLK